MGAALAAVLLAAGCGSWSESSLDVRGAKVYAATTGAGTAQVVTTFDLTTGDPTVYATGVESGVWSWTTKTGKSTTSLTAGHLIHSTTQRLDDGEVTYSKVSIPGLPPGLQGLIGGIGWTETTYSGRQRDDSGPLDFIPFDEQDSAFYDSTPSSIVSILQASASSVTDLGGAIVGGVATTHYRAVIPLTSLAELTSAELLDARDLLGAEALTVDYWTDSANLLRQLRLRVRETFPKTPPVAHGHPGEVSASLTSPVTMTIQLQLSRFGVPVHVVPPPPAQITGHVHCVIQTDGFTCS